MLFKTKNVQCKAISESTREQCKNTASTLNGKYCLHHQPKRKIIIDLLLGLFFIVIGWFLSFAWDHYYPSRESLKIDSLNITIEQGLSKLSFPFPNELIPVESGITVKSEAFTEFLPELLEIMPRKDRAYYEKHGVIPVSSTSLTYGRSSDELMKMFDGKTISIRVVRWEDDNGVTDRKNMEFVWEFYIKISLKNNQKQNFSYQQDLRQDDPDNLHLRFHQINKSNPSDILKSFGGILSAEEMCDKKVWMFIALDGTLMETPIYSIDELEFKDNNSKDYKITITGTETFYDTIPKSPFTNRPAFIHSTTYTVGKINCLSF